MNKKRQLDGLIALMWFLTIFVQLLQELQVSIPDIQKIRLALLILLLVLLFEYIREAKVFRSIMGAGRNRIEM